MKGKNMLFSGRRIRHPNAMIKLLLFGLLVLLVYLILRDKRQAGGTVPPAARPAEQMVECAHCGLHLPQEESISSGGFHFCCEQHRGCGPLKRKP